MHGHRPTYHPLAMADCLLLAKRLQAEGQPWHTHVLSPGCHHNPFPGVYAVVIEDDAAGIIYMAEGDTGFPEVDKELVRMLHGDDILDAAALGERPDSLLLEHLDRLQERKTPWHHHMHFPVCAFNPHPGRWSISIEARGYFLSEAYEDEPVDVLREVEVMYFANLE